MLEHKRCCKASVCITCISVAGTAASALYSNTNQLLECVLNKLVDYLHSSCLSLRMDHESFVLPLASWDFACCAQNASLDWPVLPKRHLKLETVLLQAIALEWGALKFTPRAFCNDSCHIYYVWNAEPVLPSGRRPPQRKFVVWVCKFAKKFVYHNDVTHGCGCIHKWSNAQTITVESLKSKVWTVL